MNKSKKILLTLVFIVALALFGWWIVSQTKANSERADKIEENLIGKTFTHIDSSKEHSFLEIEAKDGSKHFIECDYISTSEWNYSFEKDGTCIQTDKWTREFPRYEIRDWANMEDLTKEYGPNYYEYSVHISLWNHVSLKIGTGKCELLLDENDVPYGMIKAEKRYE